MKRTFLIAAALLAGLVTTTTAPAQTMVARWANGTYTGTKRGLAYNPATGNLLLVIGGAPGSIKRIKSADGTSAGTDLPYPTGGAGTYQVAGIAVASDGTIYGCNYAASGTQNLYKWTSETATPTVLWTGTYNSGATAGEAGTVGANLAVYGTGNNAVFVLSTTGGGALVIYYNGTAWTARAFTVVNQSLTSGLTFLDKDVAGPGLYRLIAKTGQTSGEIYTFDPTAGTGAFVASATNVMSGAFGFVANGLHGIAYDPVTGLIGGVTRVSSTSPFPGTNMLFNTGLKVGAGTLTTPTELGRVNFFGSTAGDGGAPGGVAWGAGAFFTSAANPGNNLFAYDVTAFKVSDISPATATRSPGDSVTFNVVSGGSSLSYQWSKNGTPISGATTATLTLTALSSADAGNYTCTVGGVSASTWTSGNGVLSVLQSTTTTLTSDVAPSTYGDAVTFTATVTAASGSPAGTVTFKDGATVLGTASLNGAGQASFGTTSLSASGSPHSITANYSGGTGFSASASSIYSQTVNPKPLVPSVSVANKTYDGTTAAAISARSLTGVVGTDDVSLGTSGSATFSDGAPGMGKAVTVVGLALSGTTAGNYTLSTTTVSTTADITTKTLGVVGLAAQNKTYDRSIAATLSGTPTLSGVVGSDAVNLTGTAAGAFNNPEVGSSKPVTVGGLGLTGADAGNYTLLYPVLNASITPAPLTVEGVEASDKVYDGTTNATLVLTNAVLTGVLAPDDVSLATTNATGAFTNKTVGTSKTVNVSGLEIFGAQAANYSLSQPSTNASISARPLTVSATAASKTYDGTLTVSVTLSDDKVAGDDVSETFTTAAYADKNSGTAKPVTVSGIALAGADATNYSLASSTVSTTADIQPIALSVVGVTANSKPWDGTTAATLGGSPALSAGVLPGDDVNLDAVSGPVVATFDSAEIGTAKTVTVSGFLLAGADRGNYTLGQPTGLTADIFKAEPVVSAWPTASAITYGQTLADSSLSGGIATPAGAFAWTTPSTAPNAGTAAQSVTFTPTDSAHYHLSVGSVNLTVNKADPLVTTWPTASTLAYGQTLADSTLSGGTASPAGAFAWTTPSTVPNAGTTAQNVTYTPMDTANYNVANGTVEVTISPASSVTSLVSSQNPSTNGVSVTFTATVSASAGTPSGQVVFLTNGVVLATVDLAGGSASVSTTGLAVGTNSVAAQYAAQANWLASTDNLAQVVYTSVTLSATNRLLSLDANGDGTYTLTAQGTPGAQYFVVTSSDLSAPPNSWTVLEGSTNTAAASGGLWSVTVSNAAPAFFRAVAIHPAP